MMIVRLLSVLFVLSLAFSHGGPIASASHDHMRAGIHDHAEHGQSHADAPAPDADHESDDASTHVHLLVDRLAHTAPVPAAKHETTRRHWPRNEPQLPSTVLAPLLEPPAA